MVAVIASLVWMFLGVKEGKGISSIVALLTLSGGVLCFPGQVDAFDYVIEYGTNAVNYPYSTQSQPAKNGAYADVIFHSTVTRVSDKAADDYNGEGLITGYSTFSGISSDGNYIVLMMYGASAKYALYNAKTNQYLKDLGLQSWNGDPEPRWDGSGSHPTWLYYVRFTSLMRMDVASADPLGTSVVVHDFNNQYADAAYIKNDEEGDSSADSRYWVFEVRDGSWAIKRLVTYDKQTDTILGVMESSSWNPSYDINCVSISPNGQYVLVDWQWTTHGTNSGPKVYNKDFTLACANEVKNDSTHWCWVTMKDGHTGIFSQNNGTMYGGTQREADAVQVFDIECNKRSYPLYYSDMGWSTGFHFFNTGKPGWGGMYCYTQPTDHSSWSYDQIFLVEMTDNGRVWRVTPSQHNSISGEYFTEGYAQMNWHDTSTKLWWNANWRGIDNQEVYRVDLPASWDVDLGEGSLNPPPPPPPPPPGGVTLNSIRVYPNPWQGDRHQGKAVTFGQLTLNSTVKIFTASGHLVRNLDGSSGTASWDLKNDSGDPAASGVYLYLITNDQGQKSRGKVAVIK